MNESVNHDRKNTQKVFSNTSKINLLVIACFVLLSIPSVIYGQDGAKLKNFDLDERLQSTHYLNPSGPYKANWQSLAKHPAAPEWFRDAKFGIYAHWGIYSVPAYDNEWYPRNMYDKQSPVYEHHLQTYGSPQEFGYPDFIPQFKAENFNADDWVSLFKKAGARFAGLVAEHHDGFAMWDSDLTPWNTADKGPNRDILGEFAAALRKQKLHFVATFHHAKNNLWKPEGKKYWIGHYSFVEQNFPSLLEDPMRSIMYGFIPRKQFLQLWDYKLKEVITKYEPDIMWFDSWLHEIPDSVKMDYLAYYFNKARELNKEVAVTYKQDDLSSDVGVKDFEKGRADRLLKQPFLTDDTISLGSWCYTRGMGIKETSVILHSLIDIVSKNGQLLLNISPKADGTIPENQKKLLLEMGAWLDINGEAIYGTRPWQVFGEGPTKLVPGRFDGYTDEKDYTYEDIRYTQKGSDLYAIAMGWPGANKSIQLRAFSKDSLQQPISIAEISVLGSEAKINWRFDEAGLTIQTPPEPPDRKAIVFKIETN